MPDVNLRDARPDDAASIIAMLQAMHARHLAWDAARWTTADPPHTTYAAWIGTLIARPDHGVVKVAEAGGIVVGYVLAEVEAESTRHWSPRAVYVHDLFVAEAQRRGGVARRLMRSVFDWAEVAQPGLQLRLMTAAPNEAARAFFSSLGFVPCVVEMIRRAP